jgi:hypothetical protein
VGGWSNAESPANRKAISRPRRFLRLRALRFRWCLFPGSLICEDVHFDPFWICSEWIVHLMLLRRDNGIDWKQKMDDVTEKKAKICYRMPIGMSNRKICSL